MKKYLVINETGIINELPSYKEGLKASKGANVRFVCVDDEEGTTKVYFDRRSSKQEQNEQPQQNMQNEQPQQEQEKKEQVIEDLKKRDLSKAEKAAFRKLGTKLQKEYESAKGFARSISNEMFVFGVLSPYFQQIYKAYLGLHVDIKIEKGLKGEARKAAIKQAEAKKAALINDMYTKRDLDTLQNSTIYRVLSNSNLIFSFLRANLVRFYAGATGNCVTLAKKIKFADLKSNLTSEEIAVSLKTKKEYTINGKTYICSEKMYNEVYTQLAGVTRKEVREDFAEAKEQSAIFEDKEGNLCALVAKDKFGMQELVPVLCRVSLRANNKKEQPQNMQNEQPQQEQEKQEKKGEDKLINEDLHTFKPFSVVIEQPQQEQEKQEQEQPQQEKKGSLRSAKRFFKKMFATA